MTSGPGGEDERDPVQSFIDEVFEEMTRETGLPHKSASALGKDPLTAALVEAAVASLARPASSRESTIEKLLFTQALATALADSLAPALAEALAAEITKVMDQHATSRSRHTESAGTGRSHDRHTPTDGSRQPKGK